MSDLHTPPPQASPYFPQPRPELAGRLAAADEALAGAMVKNTRVFPKGHVLVRAEEPHPTMFRLISGTVARIRLLDDSRRQIICIFTPGDLLAVKAIILDRQPDAIECLSKSVLQAISYNEASELASANPDVAFRYIWQLAEDERRLHNNVTMLGRGTAIERIATMLVDLAGRRSKLGLPSNEIPFSQRDIADYVGITVIHVNRTLRTLREQGAISVHMGRIVITDKDALGRHAAPMLDVFEREDPDFSGTL
jgi:CRP-like cAMP-binding protein